MARINVTQSFLPPLEEYIGYLRRIWSNAHLTNHGPLLREFEERVEQFLGVSNFHFVTNGTLALQLSLKALDITEGEIITTPFSFVATTSAILWERCEPVFVDIEPETFCIDANKIEAAITPRTKAILAVHVFGFPCDVKKIDAIAKKHGLRVIYDGAHAFGAEYDGKSLLSYGDIATCSFHATKLFHTIEGGAVIANDGSVGEKVGLVKSFGFSGDDHFMLGTNAKASEFQAAMGLGNLKYVAENIKKRKQVASKYAGLLGSKFHRPTPSAQTKHNYAYYPVVLPSERTLLKKLQALGEMEIFPRRYFYPSLNKLPYVNNAQKCPVSESIAKRILCLPFYPDMEDEAIAKVCQVLNA
jgi:dTDP-4-amino-4,6-dideoxygalactose transaminase